MQAFIVDLVLRLLHEDMVESEGLLFGVLALDGDSGGLISAENWLKLVSFIHFSILLQGGPHSNGDDKLFLVSLFAGLH